MPRSSTPNSSTRQAFTCRVLAWFRRHARDLPWRRTRDPYRVLVSEFMLQQTQVSRVTEYYPRFLARFGTLERLARARPGAVREVWDGLGYYARARNLHALARVVTNEYGGTLPADPDQLQRLPGIGPYTAGAVASFAYERPVPAVDTNVARVLRRVFFGERARAGMQRRTWEMARRLVPRDGKRAWAFNQAVMELGATICIARRPKCQRCPVKLLCRSAVKQGMPRGVEATISGRF